MNYWLPLFGLGALTAAIVIATRKDDEASGTLPPARRTPFPPFGRTPNPVLTTIGPPPGWAVMNDQQRAQFCFENATNPAWQGFCAAWIQSQPGLPNYF